MLPFIKFFFLVRCVRIKDFWYTNKIIVQNLQVCNQNIISMKKKYFLSKLKIIAFSLNSLKKNMYNS